MLLPGSIFSYFFIGFIFLTSCRHSAINYQNLSGRADSIISHTKGLLADGDINFARRYLDSSYQVFPKATGLDLWKKYDVLSKLCVDYYSDTMGSRIYADSMLLVIQGQEASHKREYAHTLFAMGDVLLAEKKYAQAFRWYYDGRSYAQKYLDSCSLAQFSSQLAMIRYKQLQLNMAIRYFQQALIENECCGSDASVDDRLLLPQYLLHMIGLCYGQLHLKDSAVFYYKESLSIIEQRARLFPQYKARILMAQAAVYGDLGGTYMFQEKYDQAIPYLTEAIRINSQPGYDRYSAETAKHDLAFLYIRTSQLSHAATLIGQLVSELRTLKIKKEDITDLVLNLYAVQWHYFDKSKQIDSAYKYQNLFFSYNDSIRKAEKELREADMEGAFANTESFYRIKLLDENDRFKSFFLFAAVILSVLLVIILVVILNGLRRASLANRQISSQRDAIDEHRRQLLERNIHMTQALAALEQSQEENTTMLKILAHDLRTPVAAIISFADFMLDEPGHSSDSRSMLEMIRKAGNNSLEMVDNLLQSNAKPEDLKKEPVDLKQMLNYCIDLLRHRALAKKQHIELLADPVAVRLNREKMWRVFSNLITNAIKFSPDGAAICIWLAEKPQSVIVAVEDHGIGIPTEIKGKIFDMSTEAKRQGTSGEQPFGLGLAISKQIVEAHEGKIWFESYSGGGTTFFVELQI